MKSPVRLKDVARAAGVSQGTASNVFNRPDLVRPAVRERVLEAARRLDYSGPDPKGRLLRAGKANAVGIVPHSSMVSALEYPYFQNFVIGVAEACDAHHAGLVVVSGIDREAGERSVRTAIVDGFILHDPLNIESLVAISKRRGLPMVGVDMEAPDGISAINLDNRDGARQAVRHLVGLGHRRFAILSLLHPERSHPGPLYHPPGNPDRQLVETFVDARQRYEGFGEALAEAGLSIGDAPVVEAFPMVSDVAAGVRLLLDNLAGATAVLTMADTLAIGVIDEARRRGITVPGDLSVVGFDDLPMASACLPPLTTVAQPVREKGRVAAELILDPPDAPVRKIMPLELIVRESTAPPRPR